MTSLVTEALAACGDSSSEGTPLPDIHNLTRQSDELKVEIYTFLKSKYEDFDAWLDKTSFLNKKVEDLSRMLSATHTRTQNELAGRLDSTDEQCDSVSRELEQCNQTLSTLDILLEIHSSVQNVTDSLKNQAYSDAAKSLSQMGSLLKELESTPGLKIAKALCTEHTVLKENLKHSLTTEWNKVVKISKPEDSKSERNDTNVITVTITKPSRPLTLKLLVSALHSEDMLFLRFKPLSDVFLLACDWIVHSPATEVADETDPASITITVTRPAADTVFVAVNPLTVYKSIGKLLELLCKALLNTPVDGGNLAGMFGSMVAEKMLTMVVKDCLAPSIPTDYSLLEEYRKTISVTEQFQSSLCKMKFISTDDQTLSDYVQNVNTLFANRKCRDILSSARKLMKEDLHRMVKLKPGDDVANWAEFIAKPVEDGGDNSDDIKSQLAKLSENTLKFPACSVSESVIKLMEFAHSMLEEASCSEHVQCSAQIFYGIRSMFELYTSVVPDHHKKSLAELPQVNALYFNNCMFISHQLILLASRYKQRMAKVMKDGCAVTFVDFVPLFRALGTEAFMDQLKVQLNNLMKCLDSTHGFKGMEVNTNYQSALQGVKQCVHQLQHLGKVWKDVLPHSSYCKAVGHLTNSVISTMITSITSLEDISAEDTIGLNQLCTLVIEAAPALFPGDKSSALGYLHRHVSCWMRFSELQFLLNASLHDITDRWADGKGPLAVEFSANVVKKLIRALFQNTDRRAATLAKVY